MDRVNDELPITNNGNNKINTNNSNTNINSKDNNNYGTLLGV